MVMYLHIISFIMDLLLMPLFFDECMNFLCVSVGYDPVCTHWLHLFFLPFLQLFFIKLLSVILDFIQVPCYLNIKKCELKSLTGCTSGELQNLCSVILKSSVRNLLLKQLIPSLPCSLPGSFHMFCTLGHTDTAS